MFDFLEDHVNWSARLRNSLQVAVLRERYFREVRELHRPGGGGFSTASQDRYHGWSRLVSTISG